MDDGQTPVPKAAGWRGIATRFFTPQPAASRANTRPVADGSTGPGDEAKRRAVFNLDPTERKWGLIGAALAAVIALWQDLPYVLNPKTPVKLPVGKNHSCTSGFHFVKAANACEALHSRGYWEFELGVLLAFALAIFITVRVGRRSPVGFTALMAGLAFEAEVGILGIPFIFGGGWLLLRAWRVQRYGTPTGTKSNPSGQRRAPPPRAERAPKGKKAKEPERKGPIPSKRYTPKTAKRKRPAATRPES